MSVTTTFPPTVEVKGFVGRNGRGEWCYFEDSFATGVPIRQADLLAAVVDTPGRHVIPAALPEPDR